MNEISEAFNRNKNLRGKYVLTGGWAPYFITLGKFEHTGSRDVDLVLSLELMKTYARIERLMVEKLGYTKLDLLNFQGLKKKSPTKFISYANQNMFLKTYRPTEYKRVCPQS